MHPARWLWQTVEPIHAVIYFVPDTREHYAAAGLRGGWMGYFASRSAPMGPVSASTVIATFHNFAPRFVERAIPDAWRLSSPERVIAARHAAATATMARLGGQAVEDDGVAAAADLLREALDACEAAGRPIYAGQASLPWPEDRGLALWHAATLLREHRFDGHVAVLTAEGVGGIEGLVQSTAAGGVDKATTLAFRGWESAEWDVAVEDLRARGLVEGDVERPAFTEAGRRFRSHIEARTDERAAAPAERLGEAGVARVCAALAPVAQRVIEGSGFPFPNPIGLARPAVGGAITSRVV